MWIKPSSKKLQLKSPSGSFVRFERFVFVKPRAVRVFLRTRIVRIYRIFYIKISSKKLQLKSPSGSFVRFERFVFVKSLAVRVFKRTRIVRIYRIFILKFKQETPASEPSGLIRAIRIIRVLKNSSSCSYNLQQFVFSFRAQRAQICVVSAIRVRHNEILGNAFAPENPLRFILSIC